MAQIKAISAITSLPASLTRFVKESRDELKKVSWPDRQTTIRYTVIVIISCLVVGGLMGGLDFILTRLLEQIVYKF